MRIGCIVRISALAGLVGLAMPLDAAAQSAVELYRQGVAQRMDRRFDEAIATLERAAALEPKNADVLVQLGFSYLGVGKLDSARTRFEQALEIAPEYQDARFGLAEVSFRRGELGGARELVRAVLEAQPENKDAAGLLRNIDRAQAARTSQRRREQLARTLAKARKLRIAGQFPEAEALYREALARSPNDADILVSLGLVLGFQQKFDAAEEFLREALRKNPANVYVHLGFVRLAIWRGEIGLARSLIDPIVARHPANSDAMLLSARIALAERRYGRAEEEYQAIATREPENVEALTGIGDARRARGAEDAARDAYNRALTLEPGSADIRERLAVAPPKKWRIDIGSEVSELTGGRSSWTDSATTLSYRLTPDTSVGGSARLATRNGKTDLQIEARIDRTFTGDFSAYGLFAATPDADFLARYSLGGGASWRAVQRSGDWGPLYVNIDLGHDVFDESRITTVSPGLQLFVVDELLGLSARWIHARDDAGTTANGYVLRADLAATDRLGLFVGYGDAPEISEASLVDTRTVFMGLSFVVNDGLTVRTNYAHETRDAFDRDTFGLGLALRF